MTAKRSVECIARWRLRFLANTMDFWIELEKDGEKAPEGSVEFGLRQIEDLQRVLEALRVKLEESKN